MNKQEFFKNIEEILTDKIYLTEDLNELNEEIKVNHWSIGWNSHLVKIIDVLELKSFLDKTRANRLIQLKESSKCLDLLFYLWLEEQSGNLNFSFINANHRKLPFDAEVEFVESADEIIDKFLNYKYHKGILLEDLSDEVDISDISIKFKVKVYQEIIKKESTEA